MVGLCAALPLLGGGDICAQVKYRTVTDQGLSAEFDDAVIKDGSSVVTVSRQNIQLTAVAGTTPADNPGSAGGQQILPDGTVLAWNTVRWTSKNQGDIDFYYLEGSGNPYTRIEAEEIESDGVGTGVFRARYTYYLPDGSNGMPVSGVYYKIHTDVAGQLRVGVWSNKNDRNTFVVDEQTMLPIEYKVEGYINGQNETVKTPTGATVTRKKYLSNEEIQALHDSRFMDSATGIDSRPYVIGPGNQAFWGYMLIDAEADHTYWFFQDSSQLGFQGFDFAFDGAESGGDDENEIDHAVADWIMVINDTDESYVGSINTISFVSDDQGAPSDARYLLLHRLDGQTTGISLANMPELRFTPATLTVSHDGAELEIPIADIKAMSFSDTATALCEHIIPEVISIEPDGIHIAGMKPGSVVRLYAIDGRLLRSAGAGNDGAVILSTEGLTASGTCILVTPNENLKIAIR